MFKPVAETFPVESGLAIQRADLARWKSVLKPEIYEKLEPMVIVDNDKAKSCYDVCRGDDITQKVLSLMYFS